MTRILTLLKNIALDLLSKVDMWKIIVPSIVGVILGFFIVPTNEGLLMSGIFAAIGALMLVYTFIKAKRDISNILLICISLYILSFITKASISFSIAWGVYYLIKYVTKCYIEHRLRLHS